MRGCGYEHCAGHSSRLQPRGAIRGLAEYVGIFAGARTDHYRA